MSFVTPLAEIPSHDVGSHGGKATNLGKLVQLGFSIPEGFSISSRVFDEMLENNKDLMDFLARIDDSDDFEEILEISGIIQKIIGSYEIPEKVVSEIVSCLDNLQQTGLGFAVRSSATIEDRLELSFAGQAESYLCIKDHSDVIESMKKVWQSAFSERAVIYLKTKGIPVKQVKMAVVVQEMVPAEVSGVLFTANVVNNNIEEMLINSTWGIGDTIVSGKIVPDTFILSKNPLSVTQKNLGAKELTSKPDENQSILTDTPKEKQRKYSLDDQTLLALAEVGLKIEMGMESPQDIEWCIRPDGHLIVLQSRPITTLTVPSSHIE